MIVEDEARTLKGILKSLPWNELNIRIVGLAGNGYDAIHLAKRHKPDIVLTDIRMPLMDGITLASKLKELNAHVKIILITGHLDTHYMKSAFKEGIVDYLLKPINIRELEQTIRRTIDQCVTEQKEEQRLAMMESRLRESLPLMQRKFLEMMVLGELSAEDVLDRQESLELTIPILGTYLVLSIHLDDYSAFKKQWPAREIGRFTKRLLEEANEELNQMGIVFEFGEGEFVAICYEPGAIRSWEDSLEAKARNRAEALHAHLNESMGLSVTIGIGARVDRLEDLKQSYGLAMHAANQKLYLGKNRIIDMKRNGSAQWRGTAIDHRIYERVYAALRDGLLEEAMGIVDVAFEEMSVAKFLQAALIRSASLQFFSVLHRLYCEHPKPEEIREINFISRMDDLLMQETIEEMRQMVLALCEEVGSLYAARPESNSSRIVERLKAIMQARFGEHLSIELLANEVFVSPPHLCMMFKQVTGETINGYLTQIRIEEAKKLLLQGTKKLVEVCLEVGYTDPKYFSKLFKKHTGMNPSDFKRVLSSC